MNPYFKAVRSVIRLVAAGMLIVGGLLAVVEWGGHRASGAAIHYGKEVIYGLLVVAGLALIAASSRLAAKLTDGDDDEAEDSDSSVDDKE